MVFFRIKSDLLKLMAKLPGVRILFPGERVFTVLVSRVVTDTFLGEG